ncbi:hypothetical protein [Bordetella genomosp. 11]|uniref:Uncharacterized protein n=1 Tax=Bordetella genomosp. 11 TaxID=1416808 RepID=A0A261UYY7_9BORD|nr:hypothetical protein [Bordetella genomosp. 11]OZI67098.1 hypothetical protein CAL28_05245 [Bordetella genomosp. 11]
MATEQELRAAAARVTELQKQLALADRGWQLLGRSRAAFISSLRHTGLSYAHAQIKFDDFVEEQRRLYEYLTQALQAAQDHYAALTATAGGTPRPDAGQDIREHAAARP